ncbi:hypothetical protein BYT27DRAFT_7219204 [Phlegmacium glaucopus]|nr:hypothetical protein BYT27DRAFT_7219204 [Phlegmacium glaucopus]
MPHKRAPRSCRSSSPGSQAPSRSPSSVTHQMSSASSKKRMAASPSDGDSSTAYVISSHSIIVDVGLTHHLSEISPQAPPKRARKDMPGSVKYDALPPVSISSPTKLTHPVGKHLSFGSIKPDSPSEGHSKGDHDLEPPLDISKEKRSRKPSAKAVYMSNAPEDKTSDNEKILATTTKKTSTSISAATSLPSSISRSHKGKKRKTDATPPVTSSEEDDHEPTPKAKRLHSTKTLAKATRPSPHNAPIVVSDSEPDAILPLSQKKPMLSKNTKMKQTVVIVSSEEDSEPLSQKKPTIMKKPSLKKTVTMSEPIVATPPRKTHKPRAGTPMRLPQPTSPNSNAASDDGSEDGLPRHIFSRTLPGSHKPMVKIENSPPTEDKLPSKATKAVKSTLAVVKSPPWDIEDAGSSHDMTEMPKDLEPLPTFELLPYSDKVQQNESYMLASDVLYESLDESIAKTFLPAVHFKKFGPFVNFAHMDLGAVKNKFKGLTIQGQKNLAISLLTGGVVSCNLVIPKVSTREGTADSKSISIIPILAEYERYISYIGFKLGSKPIHGPIYDSSYLTFSTRKDGAMSESANQSEPGTPSAKSKFFVKRAAPVTSVGWYSKPFPTFLSFGEHVPIYDLRGSSFSFKKEDFDSLRSLPQFELNGLPRDLPGNSLVTVAHTVDSGTEITEISSLSAFTGLDFGTKVTIHGIRVPPAAPTPTSLTIHGIRVPPAAPTPTSLTIHGICVPPAAPTPTSLTIHGIRVPSAAPAPTSLTIHAICVPPAAPAPTSVTIHGMYVPPAAPVLNAHTTTTLTICGIYVLPTAPALNAQSRTSVTLHGIYVPPATPVLNTTVSGTPFFSFLTALDVWINSLDAMSIPWDSVETSTWEVHLDGPALTHVQI